MFNLSDILQSAQGGQAITNLAEQFGLQPAQAQQAVNALLPALSAGLKNRAADPSALSSVIGQVSDPQHQAAFQDPAAAQSGDAQAAGQQALSQLVGSDGAVAAVADRAAQATGLPPEMLRQMLPQITTIALGGVMTAMESRGLGGVVQQLGQLGSSGGLGGLLGQAGAQAGAGQQSGGGLGGMLGGIVSSFLGGQQNQPASAPAASGSAQAGISALTQLFDHGTGASNLEQDFAQLIDKSN